MLKSGSSVITVPICAGNGGRVRSKDIMSSSGKAVDVSGRSSDWTKLAEISDGMSLGGSSGERGIVIAFISKEIVAISSTMQCVDHLLVANCWLGLWLRESDFQGLELSRR